MKRKKRARGVFGGSEIKDRRKIKKSQNDAACGGQEKSTSGWRGVGTAANGEGLKGV